MVNSTPQYTDRLVTARDAAFVVALHVAPHARTYVLPPTEDVVREKIDQPDNERRIVLDEDDTPVGFWALRAHGDGWLVELTRLIALAPRRGVGSWAMRRMLSRAFDDLGAHRTYLEVAAGNTGARALVDRFGFALEGTFRDGYRAADGTFHDLCAYGLLAPEYRSR